MIESVEISYFDIHNVKVKLTTNVHHLKEYILCNLNNFILEYPTEKCDIIVEVFDGKSNRTNQPTNVNDYVKIAKNLYLGADCILWLPTFWLEYKLSIQEGQIYINAIIYPTAKRIKGTLFYLRDKITGIDRLTEKDMFTMRLLVYFPVFWFLRKESNIGVIHGSAVVKNNKAIVLTGYNGVGKSTLAAYLCMHKGFDFLTDNFLLFDNNNVYAFPELFRYEPNFKDFNLDLLETVGKKYNAYGRKQVLLNNLKKYTKVPCNTICYNIMGSEDKICEIDVDYVKHKILAMDSYLPEFIDYNQFLSIMSLLHPDTLKWSNNELLDHFLNGQQLFLAIKNNIKNISVIMEKLNDDI